MTQAADGWDATGLYDALAPIYDAWQSTGGTTPFALVAHARLEPVLERWSRPQARSFIDLGCGTGELLLALGRAHPAWRLAGADASAGMLAVAARKAGAGRIAWVRAPITGPLPFASARGVDGFDAAGAFYDTLNHLQDADALARAMSAAAALLRPGGLFVFDVTNELGFAEWWHKRNRWVGPTWAVEVETRYDDAARTGEARVSVEVSHRNTQVTLRERCFTSGDVERALDGEKLTVESCTPWSPFSIDAPGKTLWIVRKSS